MAVTLYWYEYRSKKKSEKWFEKRFFFKFISNATFGKTIENVRKFRNIKLVATERRKNSLGSEPNYHTTKFYTEI